MFFWMFVFSGFRPVVETPFFVPRPARLSERLAFGSPTIFADSNCWNSLDRHVERAQDQQEPLLEAAAMSHSDQQHSDGAAPQWRQTLSFSLQQQTF